MNILLIGSGAREHAIAKAIKKSKYNPNLFCFGTSHNPGIKELSFGYTVGKMTDIDSIINFARSNNIDWAFVGPEAPLEAGVVDRLKELNIPSIGPTQKLAQLETSKSFTRDLLKKYNVPGSPKYKFFSSLDGVREFIELLDNNYAIKADGLMGGKGVKISGDHLQNTEEALSYCDELINNGKNFLIEEKFIGQEFSLMSFSDGKHLAHMPAVQDHKRAFVGDTGPNTGGMGSYSDADHKLPFLTDEDIAQAHEINFETIQALKNEFGEGYKGILYGGFIATKDGIKLIEYNARFGDPESINVLSILESDFIELCQAIMGEALNQYHARFAKKATVCKYAVPEGYPDNPIKNAQIDISDIENKDLLYLAAVDQEITGLVETGSRTVAVVGIADSIQEAEKQAEIQITNIKGPLFHREDIGTCNLIQKKIDMMKDLRISKQDKNNKIKIAVLGSTRGTSLQPIIDAIQKNKLNASIEIVISNKEDAYILERAKNHNIPAVYISMYKNESSINAVKKSREEFDQEVMKILGEKQIDLVLLIGYMRFVSKEFVDKWRNKIMNVHPSLLPAFAGGMDLNVHEEVLKAGVKVTGCTIHYVDEGADTGQIIVQKTVMIDENDTVDSLKTKVQAKEGEAYIEAIQNFNKNTNNVQIKRALISVSNKDGIVEFAKELDSMGIEIISTGGTAKKLAEADIPVRDISEFTGFPEMMEGRVKTLHPKVHGGILGLRDVHAEIADKYDIKWIDLVVVNLYPFSETIKKEGVSHAEVIENIDIGGPTMIRSAAKNMNWVTVVVDPQDYSPLLNKLKNSGIDDNTREKLAIKAFGHTAQYDTIIHNHLKEEKFSDNFSITFRKDYELRYGENPHQMAAVYKTPNNAGCNILNAKILQGKKLSYNNINDADGALATLKEFTEPACVVVKHANPCGVAIGTNITDVFRRAYNADAMSAFGGIIALNRTCTAEIAEEIVKVFAEIVLAPNYNTEALSILSKKKNMRVLELGPIFSPPYRGRSGGGQGLEFRYVEGGMLVQDIDNSVITKNDLQFATNKQPSDQELSDMLFGWKVLKHVKSNGILTAKNNTTLGIGPGQVSRVDAVDISIKKSGDEIIGSVLCSDAFFPFRDSIDKIATTGIKAIIQPGGSIKDQEVIDACNEHGIAMVFTGTRCFKH